MVTSVVDIDLLAYSTIARALEESLAARSVLELNDQIQSFIDQALAAVHGTRSQVVLTTTGDGAILGFDSPALACQFAMSLHEQTRQWNSRKSDPLGRRYFRVGIATGPLEIRERNGTREIAGLVISRAVRLEAKTAPGSVLIDEDTHQSLPEPIRGLFSGPEWVSGKRDEYFQGYRCACDTPDPKHLSALLPEPALFGNDRGNQSERNRRMEVLRLLAAIRPHQYEELLFLLVMPIDRRPPRPLPTTERRAIILEWAEDEADGIRDLHESLLLLAGSKA